MKIALVGHERGQAEVVSILLKSVRYECSIHDNCSDFLLSGTAKTFDFFVVDSQPTADGCKDPIIDGIRDLAGFGRPILLLTDRDLEANASAMLAATVDDCMRKPVRGGELIARVNAMMRRAYPYTELPADLIRVGEYQVDCVNRTVRLRGTTVRLSRREFDLALYLFRHVGRIVPRGVLEKAIWGRVLEVDSKTLDTHVYRLRVKLHLQPENGLQLASVYAQGFRLMPVVVVPVTDYSLNS